jgi:high-affinity Fe2+/Pb2+ permease
MEKALILAGNAQTHPTASLILGAIVVVIVAVFIGWLLLK